MLRITANKAYQISKFNFIQQTVKFSSTAKEVEKPVKRGELYYRETHGNLYGTVDDYEQRWVEHFNACDEVFELRRGLHKAFTYDIIPTTPVIEAAVKCARRLNQYAVAVRIFVVLREKVVSAEMYEQYMNHFKPLMDELGIDDPDSLGIDRV